MPSTGRAKKVKITKAKYAAQQLGQNLPFGGTFLPKAQLPKL